MTIKILGEDWEIERKTAEEDAILKDGANGYCDWTIRRITILAIEKTDNSLKDLDYYERMSLRHEIIHAFLFESGLRHNTLDSEGWAVNEEMVDWFALMHSKIHQAFIDAGVI